jgi:hypothetical protein
MANLFQIYKPDIPRDFVGINIYDAITRIDPGCLGRLKVTILSHGSNADGMWLFLGNTLSKMHSLKKS